MKAIACEKSEHFAESRKAFETAAQLSPNYVPALKGAAERNYKDGSERASFYLERLLVLNPQDPTTHAMVAVIAYKKRDCSKAIKHFGLAQEVIGSSAEALSQFAVCLLYMDRPAEATHELLTALALQPEDARVRRGLGTAQLRSLSNHY